MIRRRSRSSRSRRSAGRRTHATSGRARARCTDSGSAARTTTGLPAPCPRGATPSSATSSRTSASPSSISPPPRSPERAYPSLRTSVRASHGDGGARLRRDDLAARRQQPAALVRRARLGAGTSRSGTGLPGRRRGARRRRQPRGDPSCSARRWEHGDVRLVDPADQGHVAEDARVAREVELRPVLHFDDDSRRPRRGRPACSRP